MLAATDELLEKTSKQDRSYLEEARPGSRSSSAAAALAQNDQETEIADGEEEELFGDFQFRSFKRHKQMEEDYSLLELEDPEDVTAINTVALFPEEKVSREALEIVPITKKELSQETKKQEKDKKARKKADN